MNRWLLIYENHIWTLLKQWWKQGLEKIQVFVRPSVVSLLRRSPSYSFLKAQFTCLTFIYSQSAGHKISKRWQRGLIWVRHCFIPRSRSCAGSFTELVFYKKSLERMLNVRILPLSSLRYHSLCGKDWTKDSVSKITKKVLFNRHVICQIIWEPSPSSHPIIDHW